VSDQDRLEETEVADPSQDLQLLGCDVDLGARVARWPDGARTLTPTEASLLRYLVAAEGRAVDRAELLEQVWGYRPGVVSRTVKTTVARLRAKTERDPREPDHLRTVVGRGYRFVPANPAALAQARSERPVGPDEEPGADAPTRVDLPPAPEGLVGRDRVVASVRAACATPGLVSLVGPGGVGKTAAALLACHGEVAGETWDEVRCVHLSACTTATDLVAALAAALGVVLEAGDPDAAAPFLAGALRGRGRMLLLLDGSEAAAAELAHLLPSWASSCPGITLLVTTREVLRVAGEVVVPIEPLAQDDAVALFLGRLGPNPAAGFTRAAVADLVELLDRIPLAIEMAAAWGDLVTAESLARRLGSQLDVLRSPRRDRPTRHGSLRTTIASSWSLLDEPARAGLKQLATFADAFSVEDAEHVIAGVSSPFELLRGLRDRSLLTRAQLPSGEPGLRLFRAVRDFAREQGLDGAAAIRHGQWAGRWGDTRRLERLRARGGPELPALAAARADLVLAGGRARERGDSSVLAACAFALATLGELAGPALADPELLLALADADASPSTTLRALASASALLAAQGQPERAQELVDRLAPLLDQVSTDEAARALLDAARAVEGRSLGQAHAATVRARSLAEEAGDAGLLALTTARVARIDHARGDAAAARGGFEAALDGLAASGHLREEARTLSALADLHAERGRPLRAMALHEQALHVHQEVGDRLAQAGELDAIASLRALSEDHRGATEAWDEALALVRASGDRRLEATIAAHRASADRARGRGEASRLRLLEALALAREVGDVRVEVFLLGELGELDLSLGHLSAAKAALLRAVKGAVRLGAPDLEGVSRGALGELLACSGELEQGRTELVRGAALLDDARRRLALVTLLERHAEVEAAAGDAEAATALLERAADAAELSVLDGSA
jgi:predicted ATPase/DNA-binding winged helix-turn-helix (wHTH) protein/tetratricopeptide (TPR) repeat protein